jgi:hypothetical protein
MTGTPETIALLQRVSDLLTRLSPEDLRALETGEAELQVVRTTPPQTGAAARQAPDVEQVSQDLEAISDRAMAARYLTDLNLTQPQLVELAKGLGVAADGEDSIATTVAKIVEQKVGYRVAPEPPPKAA